MTVSPGAGETFPLGPGTLEIGATGTEVDVSCLINNALISADKDEGDATTKLCGTVVPGDMTYTYKLAGNVDLDIADASGLWAISQSGAGTSKGFTFTPSTDAGMVATGSLILDPLPFGGDESGKTMAADFEFTIVGKPAYAAAGGAVVSAGSSQPHKVTPPRIPPPDAAPASAPAPARQTADA